MKITTTRKSITVKIIMAIAALSFALQACNPADLLTGKNTNLENQARSWATETCRQRPDGTCKAIGEK